MASTLLLLGMSLALVLPAGAVLPTLVPRATDIDVFSLCPMTTQPAKVSSYLSCYSSEYMSLAACTVKASEESCICAVVSQLVSSCAPIVCPPDVGPLVISAVGCNGGPGATMTGTDTYVGGGSKTGTSYTTVKATATGVNNSTATGKTTGTVLGTDATSSPTDTDTGSATQTGGGSATGTGSGAGAQTTSSSSAFASEVVIPVAGSFLAGILGVLAFLL